MNLARKSRQPSVIFDEEDKKNLLSEKTDDMVKTTKRYCANCRYNYGEHYSYTICGYYHYTGERRKCHVGYCNKKELKKRSRRKAVVIR